MEEINDKAPSEPKEPTKVQKYNPSSIAAVIAREYDMTVEQLLSAVKFTVFPPADRQNKPPSDANLVAYLSVCHHNGLDPFGGMVWPFPMKTGGFRPVTSLDGFLFIKNNHPQYEGDQYEEIYDDKGNLIAGKMTIFRKGKKELTHTEWLSEVARDTEPWKMKHRMLENRVTCQTVRRAFGIGLADVEDIQRADEINITGESVVLERTTAEKTQAIKQKIGAIQEKKAANKPEPAKDADKTSKTPVETASAPASPPQPAAEKPEEASKPEPIKTEPKTEPVPEKVGEAQRKEFLEAAQKRAEELNLTEAQATAKLREILFDSGFTKFAEVTMDKYAALLQAAKEFTA